MPENSFCCSTVAQQEACIICDINGIKKKLLSELSGEPMTISAAVLQQKTITAW